MSLKGTALPVITLPDPPPLVDRDLAGFFEALARTVTGEVRVDRLSRALYSTDASVYQIVPAGVVLPGTEADVVNVVRACARFGVPLTARGGGTSQAGQSIGPGVILDTSKYLNQIEGIDPAARVARVRPGCVLDDLNRALKPHGLKFAPDISTASRATIGGMIANNSSGARSVIYGKTGDHVLGLKVVLADGSVVETGPLDPAGLETKCLHADLEGMACRTVRDLAAEHADEIARRYPKILRRVGGYDLPSFLPGAVEPFDLTRLFVGSEGTLGVVVEATLRLVELPRAKAVLVAQFDDLLDALAATPAILTHHPSAVEVLDRYVLESTKLNPEAARLRDFLRGDPGAILFIELYGDDHAELPPRLDALETDLTGRFPSVHLLRAIESTAQARIWKLREMALGLSMAEKGDAKAISFVEDTAVAPEHLRDYIAEFLRVIARHGTRAGVYAHASVGCLHVRPVIDMKTAAGVHAFESIAAEVADLVLKYGGALSGEHGDGLVRSPFQEKMYGPALYRAFRQIKRAFDPNGLLNPGKIVDAPPLASSLRFGPGYITPDVATTFDFSADGGILRAAELCAGVGACRKKAEGTMCPSYQATRDERDSTRGRAPALRLAITGQADLSGLADPALHEVFDLCLECKACKAECPTNVDMARLKAEFLHQTFRATGLPWRNRVFGRVDLLSRWGSRLAPVSNWAARGRLGRWLNERLLGIDRRRIPPAFARRTLRDRFGDAGPTLYKSAPSELDDPSRQVLLFPDTFANHHEPDVGVATAELLGLAGCAVTLGPRDLRCCGRPQISSGLLDGAVENARHNVARLHEWAARGRPIVACEPSCLLTIKDDYPALLRGDDRVKAETVAAACLTFEELLGSILAGDEAAGHPRLTFRAGPRRLLVQAHCHQRALVGTGPLMNLLRRVPGAEVIDLDAGCCGMAGSFGYETEHYEVSRLIGEQRLFPSVRGSDEAAVIVAPGLSCRLQLDHFTHRAALHPATFLRALAEEGSRGSHRSPRPRPPLRSITEPAPDELL
jgi:FAD/FMN-containing dehydrogenase/Fe-S oxidoreductase